MGATVEQESTGQHPSAGTEPPHDHLGALLRLQRRAPGNAEVVHAPLSPTLPPSRGIDDDGLSRLTQTLREASSTDDPSELLAKFAAWFQKHSPADRFIAVSRRNLPPGHYKITRVRDNIRSTATAPDGPANPWRDWNQLQTYAGGFIWEAISGDEPRVIEDHDFSSDPLLADALAGMRSCVAFPNFDAGEALNWGLFFKAEPGFYTQHDLISIMLNGNLLGMATRNLVTRRQVTELNARLRDRIEEIGAIQRSLLPAALPAIPGLEIRASYETSEEAGGDYYDFFHLPTDDSDPSQWGILIADVAGHGPAAATVMAMLRAILHCYEHHDRCPAGVLEFSNTKLLRSNLSMSFATAFFATYDASTGRLAYARAGHNPPRLRRADKRIESLDEAHALPLGVVEPLDATVAEVILEPGDLLLLYTDGITEAFGPDREMFGVERLDDCLGECSGCPDHVIEVIQHRLRDFTHAAPLEDDRTALAIRRTASTPQAAVGGGADI